MDIFYAYATDPVAESSGRTFPLSKDSEIKVARTGNPAYLKALRQRMQDSQIDTEDTSEANEALVTKLINETLSETILLGWKGLKFKGEDLPYSREAALKLLALPDFRKRVTVIADNYQSFLVKEEVAQGNA